MPPLLPSLRAATHNPHEALHVHPLLLPLSRADITLNDYTWIIATFYAAYAHMEACREFREEIGCDSPLLDWLEKDLQKHSIKKLTIAPYPYPVIENLSQLLGYLYVKQGSTLGGRVITKHLQKYLGLQEKQDNFFFAGYSENTGAKWKEFCQLLEAQPADSEQTIFQAIKTFECFTYYCDEAYKMKNM